MESRLTPKQQKRQQERELINEYHKLVTEQTLKPLYQSFLDWKSVDNKWLLERWGYEDKPFDKMKRAVVKAFFNLRLPLVF